MCCDRLFYSEKLRRPRACWASTRGIEGTKVGGEPPIREIFKDERSGHFRTFILVALQLEQKSDRVVEERDERGGVLGKVEILEFQCPTVAEVGLWFWGSFRGRS